MAFYEPGRPEQAAADAPKTKEEIKADVIDFVRFLVIAVAVVVVLLNFVIINATIPSGSMENTIMTGDRIIGLRLAYIRSDPKRYDIVIFKYPDDESILYIKRVIGMPGETVEIKDGDVFIDGNKLEEPYLTVATEGDFGPYKVPEDHYFMLGDNRNNSADSRYWKNTYLSREGIVGKAVLRYWPKIKKINAD